MLICAIEVCATLSVATLCLKRRWVEFGFLVTLSAVAVGFFGIFQAVMGSSSSFTLWDTPKLRNHKWTSTLMLHTPLPGTQMFMMPLLLLATIGWGILRSTETTKKCFEESTCLEVRVIDGVDILALGILWGGCLLALLFEVRQRTLFLVCAGWTVGLAVVLICWYTAGPSLAVYETMWCNQTLWWNEALWWNESLRLNESLCWHEDLCYTNGQLKDPGLSEASVAEIEHVVPGAKWFMEVALSFLNVPILGSLLAWPRDRVSDERDSQYAFEL